MTFSVVFNYGYVIHGVSYPAIINAEVHKDPGPLTNEHLYTVTTLYLEIDRGERHRFQMETVGWDELPEAYREALRAIAVREAIDTYETVLEDSYWEAKIDRSRDRGIL